MSIVTTARPIDLVQLGEELAAAVGLAEPVGLSMSDNGEQRTIRCDNEAITETILDDVIDAHTPAPPTPGVGSRLQAQVDELTDLFMEMLG